jgi:hypothetical protein
MSELFYYVYMSWYKICLMCNYWFSKPNIVRSLNNRISDKMNIKISEVSDICRYKEDNLALDMFVASSSTVKSTEAAVFTVPVTRFRTTLYS